MAKQQWQEKVEEMRWEKVHHEEISNLKGVVAVGVLERDHQTDGGGRENH